ncbi:hypothetical protein QUA82_35155 [Microcoleus sp. F8-D3]
MTIALSLLKAIAPSHPHFSTTFSYRLLEKFLKSDRPFVNSNKHKTRSPFPPY